MTVCQPVSSKMTVALEVVLVSSDGSIVWDCARCHHELEVHQPDAGNPSRLLGTCPQCGCWSIRDDLADGRDGALLLVPEPVQLRDAIDSEATRPPAVPFVRRADG